MRGQADKAIPREVKTRVGTGAAPLAGVDMRTTGGRRYRELCYDLAAHVGGTPTPTQEAIIRRAAGLAVWCEQQEAAQASGADLDIQAFTTAANSLRRLLADLGFAPRAKDVTDLSQYLAARGGADA